jgi:hypothetical protein
MPNPFTLSQSYDRHTPIRPLIEGLFRSSFCISRLLTAFALLASLNSAAVSGNSSEPTQPTEAHSSKRLCGQFLVNLQRLSLDSNSALPYSGLPEEFIRPGGLGYEIESLIIEAFEFSPLTSQREKYIQTIKEKTGFSRTAVLDLLTYYAVDIWEQNLEFVSPDPSDRLKRLVSLGKIHFLLENPRWHERFGYFRKKVGRISVVEMARERSSIEGQEISQGEIYFQLQRLGLSLSSAYPTDVDLRSRSAADLGMSEQAYEFARHARDIEWRGVGWGRSRPYRGELLSEEEILVRLYLEAMSVPEIRQRLESMFGSQPPRTEASIQTKLKEMGLTEVISRDQRTIARQPYGLLLDRGEIVRENLMAYMIENQSRQLSEISNDLGIAEERLRNFLNGMHFPRWTHGRREVGSSVGGIGRVQRQRQRYQEQEREEFADLENGTLSVLGKGDGFSWFSADTPRFFRQMLEALSKRLQWTEEQTIQIQSRIDQVRLLKEDGGAARTGKQSTQDRLIRVLRIIQEASDFERPLLSKKAYEDFLQQKLKSTLRADDEVTQDQRAAFAAKKTGALSALGNGDGFKGFNTETPRLFRQMLEALSRRLQWTEEQKIQIQSRIDQVQLLKDDGTRARRGNQSAQDRLIRALRIIQEASDFERPLLSKKAYEDFLQQKLNVTLKAADEVTEDERAAFAAEETGVLSALGNGDGFKGFTADTPRYFRQMPEALSRRLEWTEEQKIQIQSRIDQVQLLKKDGSAARTGNQSSQDRLIRALRIIQEASDFERPLISKEAYEDFLQQKLNVTLRADDEVTQDQRAAFAALENGTLSVLGKGDGFSWFAADTPRFFRQMLEALSRSLQWTEEQTIQIQSRMDQVQLLKQDGSKARTGNQSSQDRLIRALRIIQEASDFERPLLSKEAYEDFLQQKLNVTRRAEKSL